MNKIFAAVCGLCLVSSQASAQFLDVNRIGQPKASRSIMFQEPVNEPAAEQPAPEKPKRKKTAPAVTSLFKKGDVKIVAVVNGEAVSSDDIENYGKLFLLNTGVPLNVQTKPMILNKVTQTVIDEKLKTQEAEKNGITVSDKDLKLAMDSYESARKLKKGELNRVFKQKGISLDTLKSQLRTEILWARLVRRKMMSESHITQREIEDAIKRSNNDMSSPKYMVSEIVIPQKGAKNINTLVENIRRDGLFNMYAAQFSKSPSASRGGNLGWLKEGQLPAVLENKVKRMKDGQVSEPIKYGENYYILKLDQSFDPKRDKPAKITYDEMKNVLEAERFEGYASKYMQNLRQKSVIELKG